MTRDEVLAALSRAEVDYVKVQVESKTVWAFGDADWKAKALRAAAELIRAGGWRPIAEAPEGRQVVCGKHLPRGGDWLVYRFFSTAHAAKEGYTHYLPEPEPPAREDSKAKNGE